MKPSSQTRDGADGTAIAFDKRVQLLSLRRVVVVGVAAEAVGMDGEAVAARRHLEAAVLALIDRGQAAEDLAGDAAARDGVRNAIVLGADDAANGLRAVAQRGGAAHHLDAIGCIGIDRHGVILGKRGDVVRADAVLLHADTIVVEAADDGPVGAGGEIRSRDAGLRLQRVGQRRAAVLLQVALGRDRDRHEGVGGHDQRSWRRLERCRVHRARRRLALVGRGCCARALGGGFGRHGALDDWARRRDLDGRQLGGLSGLRRRKRARRLLRARLRQLQDNLAEGRRSATWPKADSRPPGNPNMDAPLTDRMLYYPWMLYYPYWTREHSAIGVQAAGAT